MQQRVTIAPLAQEEEIHGTLVTIEDVTREMISRLEKASLSAAGIQALSSQDWTVRREAAESLSSAGKTIISEVLRRIRFEHKDLSILSSAMKVISMSEADVNDFLMEFLGDEDTELRIYAAQMLGEKNSPVVVEALINALDDPDTNVRYHAIESLGKLRAFQAVEKLAEIAMTRDFLRHFLLLTP
jgi:HEAT repeat protein